MLQQSSPDFQGIVLLSDYYEMNPQRSREGRRVWDVDVESMHALNESERQIPSTYSDVERVNEAVFRPWRAFLVVRHVVLALFTLVVVAYGNPVERSS